MTPAARDIIERTMAACDGWPTPTEGAIEALCGHVRDCLRELDRLADLLSRARTGTEPDGSACWCDEDELREEQNEADARSEYGAPEPEHTRLCREITEALHP